MFASLLYGAHPYGHTSLGNERSLAEMNVDDVRSFHAAVMRPGETTLVAVGDCDHETIRRLASRGVRRMGWRRRQRGGVCG